MSYDDNIRVPDFTLQEFEPHELRHVAKIAAGAVAVADEPTPDEVTALRDLLDMLGIGMIQ